MLQIVCVCIWISTCSADVGYYGPIYKAPFYKEFYKEPIYKGPYYKGFYKGPIYKGIYKSPIYYSDDEYPGYEFDGEWPIVKEDKWIDYWNVFKETFLQSYEELKKPFIVEKHIPIPGKHLYYRTKIKEKVVKKFSKETLSNVNNNE